LDSQIEQQRNKATKLAGESRKIEIRKQRLCSFVPSLFTINQIFSYAIYAFFCGHILKPGTRDPELKVQQEQTKETKIGNTNCFCRERTQRTHRAEVLFGPHELNHKESGIRIAYLIYALFCGHISILTLQFQFSQFQFSALAVVISAFSFRNFCFSTTLFLRSFVVQLSF